MTRILNNMKRIKKNMTITADHQDFIGSDYYSKAEPEYNIMVNLFKECGINLSEQIFFKFWQFHKLLRAKNKELDLTRLHSFENLVLKHYIDCAIITTFIDFKEPLLDIGTGAGFPAIPIKLIKPDLHIIMAEPRSKKLDFLEEAINMLNIERISLYPHKVNSNFDLPVSAVITRDFEAINKTLERISIFLPKGGLAYFLKGPSVDYELKAIEEPVKENYRLISDIPYIIGKSGLKRRLIIMEKTAEMRNKTIMSSNDKPYEIASRNNEQYKTWLKLFDGRGVKKHNMAVVSGVKQIHEFLEYFPRHCTALIDKSFQDIRIPAPEHVINYRVRKELFPDLDIFGAGPPLLLIKPPDMPEWDNSIADHGCTLFIPFQDPANVGAVIRSSAALGVVKIVILKEAAHPFHPKSLRAAGSAVLKVPLYTGPSIKELNSADFPLLVLDVHGNDIKNYCFPKAFGLLPGVEGPGIPQELKNINALSIPMQPGIESLNAAVATAITLYEYSRTK